MNNEIKDKITISTPIFSNVGIKFDNDNDIEDDNSIDIDSIIV